MEELPTQQIQEMAEQYCLYRSLARPRTNLKTAAAAVVLYGSAGAAAAVCFIKLSGYPGMSSLLPHSAVVFMQEHPCLSGVILWIMVCVIMGILRMRSIFIGLVHLYQHYAPEEIRRRCLLQPTCSEYMILAIEKYGAVKGAAKGIRRLFFTCRGNIYRIDYPYESWK